MIEAENRIPMELQMDRGPSQITGTHKIDTNAMAMSALIMGISQVDK